jgi:hypothetical protein
MMMHALSLASNLIAMATSQHLAQHLQQVFFGGNWSCSCLQTQLEDVTWQEAIAPNPYGNNIATLTYHIGYYVDAIIPVINGGELLAKDALSFNHPPVHNTTDWGAMVQHIMQQATVLVGLLNTLPDTIWEQTFVASKYGTYYRNILGLIEHTHYHLGQIALIKKIIRNTHVTLT